jgi:hypothetical protein
VSRPNPVSMYLAELSPGSRRTMQFGLGVACRFFGGLLPLWQRNCHPGPAFGGDVVAFQWLRVRRALDAHCIGLCRGRIIWYDILRQALGEDGHGQPADRADAERDNTVAQGRID